MYHFNLQIDLKAGRNVINWQVTAITYGSHDRREPVYIRSIEIQGLTLVLIFYCTVNSFVYTP